MEKELFTAFNLQTKGVGSKGQSSLKKLRWREMRSAWKIWQSKTAKYIKKPQGHMFCLAAKPNKTNQIVVGSQNCQRSWVAFLWKHCLFLMSVFSGSSTSNVSELMIHMKDCIEKIMWQRWSLEWTAMAILLGSFLHSGCQCWQRETFWSSTLRLDVEWKNNLWIVNDQHCNSSGHHPSVALICIFNLFGNTLKA